MQRRKKLQRNKVTPDNTTEVDTSKVKTEPKEKQKGAVKGKLPQKKKVMPKNLEEVDTLKLKTEPKEKQKPAVKGKPPQKKKVVPKGDTSTDVKQKEGDDTQPPPCPKGYVEPKADMYEKAVSDWFEERNLKNWEGFMKEIDKQQVGALLGLIRGSIKQQKKGGRRGGRRKEKN